MAEHDSLGERIEREERLESARAELERRAEEARAKRPLTTGETHGTQSNITETDAFRAFMVYGVAGMKPEERALLKAATEERAQGTGTTAGGYTIPTDLANELVKSLAAWGPMLDPGVTRQIVTAAGNTIYWPTVNDTSTVGVRLAENTAATSEGDVTFGQKQLDAYKYSSGPILVSSELLQDSAFDIGAILNDLMGERIARKVNTDLTTGDGSGDPNGIVTATSAGKTTAGVAAVTADEIIDFYHSIDPAYRSLPSFRFMFNDSTLQAIRKLKDGQNRYLIDGLRDNAASINLAGISVPYSVNQAMASMATGAKFMLAGAFDKYIVRRVREFVVRRSDELYLTSDQSVFVGFARFDGDLMDTGAVKHMKNA
jgi:HK97 family phage major capsid protein